MQLLECLAAKLGRCGPFTALEPGWVPALRLGDADGLGPAASASGHFAAEQLLLTAGGWSSTTNISHRHAYYAHTTTVNVMPLLSIHSDFYRIIHTMTANKKRSR